MKYYGISTGEQGCGIGDVIEGSYYNGSVDEGWTVNDIDVYYVFVIENNEIKQVGGI